MSARTTSTEYQPPLPVKRMLQIYAFDPSLDLDLDLARINRSLIEVPWENLQPGPVGEYVEVVDVDPPSECVYAPVDLDHPHLLAVGGLSPSEGTPQFHQQMVYAVAMKTIANFEQALGRKIHWATRNIDEDSRLDDGYVQRLRIYPHATREANAYYSPDKKALLLGYFNALNADPREGLPGGIVFSCLSHDIVAHEMTHAIVDGIHRRLIEPTNNDSLALHEAFGDLVAIFQHFTLPGVVEQQIRHTRGDLRAENLLAKLAVQFGRATKHGNALRDMLGAVDRTGKWQPRDPDPELINNTFEPHARGAILVAAMFSGFLTIYKSHISDLLRIATSGTGVLPAGELHPDLVARLASEACTVAQRLLIMYMRALDYLPPVDVTFGDFLRALITSDFNQMPDDQRHYRIALIAAFRDWGLYPRDVRALSVETLCWNSPDTYKPVKGDCSDQEFVRNLLPPVQLLRLMTYPHESPAAAYRMLAEWLTMEGLPSEVPDNYLSEATKMATGSGRRRVAAHHETQRYQEFQSQRTFARIVHRVLMLRAKELSQQVENPADIVALRARVDRLLGVDLFSKHRDIEVHAVRPTVRTRAEGHSTTELMIMITQRREKRLSTDAGEQEPPLYFGFRSGCTLLIDAATGTVRYTIVKRMGSEGRLARQRQFLQQRLAAEGPQALGRYGIYTRERDSVEHRPAEPFRMLHRGTLRDPWDE